MEQRLKASESLSDHPRSRRPQVISQEVIQKIFENDPCQRLTRLAQEKKISVSTMSKMAQQMGGNPVPRNPCWVQQWWRSVRREPSVCWMTWKITRIQFSFFFDKKTFTVDAVFNKRNDRVVTFGIDISGRRRVSTTKHPSLSWYLSSQHRTERRCLWLGFNELQANLYGERLWKNLWRRKLFHGSRSPLRNQITSSNRTGRRHTQQRLCRTAWTPTWGFSPKTFGPPIVTRFEPPRFSL